VSAASPLHDSLAQTHNKIGIALALCGLIHASCVRQRGDAESTPARLTLSDWQRGDAKTTPAVRSSKAIKAATRLI
jgi:hypothetical protein